MYNSAYFEHAFLAQQMGVELVEGRTCSSRTTSSTCAPRGPAAGGRDLPPRGRRLPRPAGLPPDSTLGVPGLLEAYRAGNVALQRHRHRRGRRQVDLPLRARDDRFYLGEEPILNNVPTYMCRKPDDLKYVLATCPNWWSRKCTAPAATACWSARPPRKAEIETSAARCWPTPGYIAQPTLACRPARPSSKRHRAAPHRPAPLRAVGQGVQMVPGGLTRVALKEGSLVVNSSQGGGTKDTWVLEN
jgi:uncharacterized circularly permuted ATP-grasp superfamily protein